MKVEIERHPVTNVVVGYKLIKESEDDHELIERIRDMHFWGSGEDVIKYNGRKSDDDDNTIELSFSKKYYRDERRKEKDAQKLNWLE